MNRKRHDGARLSQPMLPSEALEATAATRGLTLVTGNTTSLASASLLVGGCASGLRSTKVRTSGRDWPRKGTEYAKGIQPVSSPQIRKTALVRSFAALALFRGYPDFCCYHFVSSAAPGNGAVALCFMSHL